MNKGPLQLPVEYALISSKALERDLLTFYKFSEHSTVLFIHQGFHDTYLITSPGEKFILRLFRAGWKTFEQVQAELALLLLLKERGLGISYPIADKNNDLIQEIRAPEGVRFAVVFSYAPGEKITSLNPDLATLFGNHLATIHLATVDRHIPNLHRNYSVDGILESTLLSIQMVLPHHKSAIVKLDGICKELKKRLTMSVLANLRSGICHGDPHHENVFIEASSKNLTFFDFDFSGNGFLLYDLGSFCFYERNSEENINAFLNGYEAVVPLNRTEKELLSDFTVLMQLFHLGARSRNCDGVRNPIWFPEEIAKKIDEIEKEVLSMLA